MKIGNYFSQTKIFILSFLIFSFWIYIGWILLSPQESEEQVYETYDAFTDISNFWWVDKSQIEKETKQKYEEFLTKNLQDEKDKFSLWESQINFFPSYIADQKSLENKLRATQILLNSEIFSRHKIDVTLELYEKKSSVRGTFQHKKIQIFWVKYLSDEEYFAVLIHELGHYLDVNYFEKKVLFDLSNRFYDYSWDSSKVKKAWVSGKDFVSGYAMTNKYEDFAETFIYFVVYNQDFLTKSQDSDILAQKYNFFSEYVFPDNSFVGTSFWKEKVQSYYWDITKIDYFLENLLNYFQK